jgi:hypothetical protein
MSRICLYVFSAVSIGLAQSDLTQSVGDAIANEPSNAKWWIIVAFIIGAAFFLRTK